MSVADLQAFLPGIDEATASALLEAASGDLELAINLGMDSVAGDSVSGSAEHGFVGHVVLQFVA